ncbi:MAG: hypothetical protein R2764_03345 [Bacteroidales bacterium]
MMRKLIIVVLIGILGCSQPDQKPQNKLLGTWAFLDVRGNYNEALFMDSIYYTYNMRYGLTAGNKYYVKNDSLYSDIDSRRKGMSRIAKFRWLTDDLVILSTEFSKDTLERLINASVTLENTDAKKDSSKFRTAFNKRYEDYLVRKGILSREEIEEFKNEQKVPEDVIERLKGE